MTIHPEQTYPPLLAQGQTWEEMSVGSAFRTAAPDHHRDRPDHLRQLPGGFTEPLFLDASHAAAGGYTGRLVPGALVFCIGEGLVLQTNVLHGTGLAFMAMDLTIERPAYVGDTLHVVVEVNAGDGPRAPAHGGVVTTRNSVRNQRGEDVLVYTPVRLIRRRAATSLPAKARNGQARSKSVAVPNGRWLTTSDQRPAHLANSPPSEPTAGLTG